MHETRTISVVIQGRVQGVSYRVWTRGEARRLDLAGFVCNRDDGSVEALFSGPPAAVDDMLTLCRSGPPGARVTEIAVSERAEAPASREFEILRG